MLRRAFSTTISKIKVSFTINVRKLYEVPSKKTNNASGGFIWVSWKKGPGTKSKGETRHVLVKSKDIEINDTISFETHVLYDQKTSSFDKKCLTLYLKYSPTETEKAETLGSAKLDLTEFCKCDNYEDSTEIGFDKDGKQTKTTLTLQIQSRWVKASKRLSIDPNRSIEDDNSATSGSDITLEASSELEDDVAATFDAEEQAFDANEQLKSGESSAVSPHKAISQNSLDKSQRRKSLDATTIVQDSKRKRTPSKASKSAPSPDGEDTSKPETPSRHRSRRSSLIRRSSQQPIEPTTTDSGEEPLSQDTETSESTDTTSSTPIKSADSSEGHTSPSNEIQKLKEEVMRAHNEVRTLLKELQSAKSKLKSLNEEKKLLVEQLQAALKNSSSEEEIKQLKEEANLRYSMYESAQEKIRQLDQEKCALQAQLEKLQKERSQTVERRAVSNAKPLFTPQEERIVLETIVVIMAILSIIGLLSN